MRDESAIVRILVAEVEKLSARMTLSGLRIIELFGNIHGEKSDLKDASQKCGENPETDEEEVRDNIDFMQCELSNAIGCTSELEI